MTSHRKQAGRIQAGQTPENPSGGNSHPERKDERFSTLNLARMAILAALASILFLLEIPVGMPFYKLDLSNIPVLLGGFAMGPVQGALILLLKSLIGLLHTSSGGIGELADFLMGLMLILPATILYQRSRTRRTALIGMAWGIICMTVGGVLINKWVMLPFYMGRFHMTMEQLVQSAHWGGVDSEWKLLLLITAPFNLLKGAVISGLTYALYKPLSPLLHERKR